MYMVRVPRAYCHLFAKDQGLPVRFQDAVGLDVPGRRLLARPARAMPPKHKAAAARKRPAAAAAAAATATDDDNSPAARRQKRAEPVASEETTEATTRVHRDPR